MSMRFVRLARRACLPGLFAVLSACGGGGGGGNSISISPKSLTFVGSSNSPAPMQTVDVQFDGAGVLVGYAPGVTPADWLGADGYQVNEHLVRFTFAVSPYVAPGMYATSVRFVTGNQDGSDVKYRDMTVTYYVSELTVSPGSMSFEAIDGSEAAPTPAQRSFTIGGSGPTWTASSSQAWLALEQTAGSTPATVGFALHTDALSLGTHQASITVRDPSTDDAVVIPVTLDKRAPRLVVTPTPAEFTLDAASSADDFALTVHVTDELGGTDASRTVSWTLDAPSVPWLAVDAAAGSSAPGADVQLSLVPDEIAALPNGTQQTTLTFRYSNAQTTSGVVQLPVSLNVSLPRAARVMPGVAVVGRVAPVVLHGEMLGGLQASQVTFGGVAAQSLTVLSNTEIRVLPPAGLTAGTSEIDITNAAGVDLSPASLAVVAPRDRPYAAFATTGLPSRVLFDDARETLWVANSLNGKVERYRFDGTSWSALTPFSITSLVDIARHPDGKTLLVVALEAIYTIDLDDVAAVPVQRVRGQDLAYGDYSFFRAAPTADGQLVLSSDPPCCTGVFPNFRVDLATWTAREFQWPIGDSNARVAGSLDGTRVHITGSYERYRYRSEQGVLDEVGGPNLHTANRDGSRLAYFGAVYDNSFTLVGQMSASSLFTAFGPSSQRIYGYRRSTSNTTAGRNVIINDMTGASGGGTFTEVARVALADEPGWDELWNSYDFVYAGAPLAVSADERTVFVRGRDKLVIQPVPAP